MTVKELIVKADVIRDSKTVMEATANIVSRVPGVGAGLSDLVVPGGLR